MASDLNIGSGPFFWAFARVVNRITLLPGSPINLEAMLFLAAFARLWQPRDPEPNDLLAQSHAALGHAGLTIIAVVFVLLSFWKS